MRFKLNIPEDSIKTECEYTSDVLKENKKFPVLTIGRDSYIEEVMVDNVLDNNLIYSVQVGRHSSIAHDVTFIVDMNHDYGKPCQGRIGGVKYNRPEQIKRKGQIIIMNDCWIGEKSTILSGVTIGNGAVVAAGSLVSKSVPPYAIVAGNPAKIIGYRFEEEQIENLNLIRWWNWPASKVSSLASELYGDIDEFICKHIAEAKKELASIPVIDIKPIEKQAKGEEKIYLYIPDFEQDYPTYPQVIDGFVKSFADTNKELLLYIKEDELLNEKLAILDEIFALYQDVNCYVNLYIGNVEDERSIFGQVDAYITNRSKDNVKHMDMADLFGLPIISSVDIPVFEEIKTHAIIRCPESNSREEYTKDDVSKLVSAIRSQNSSIQNIQSNMDNIFKNMSQLSVNQYAMNCSIDNLKYEIFQGEKTVYPIVETVDKVIDLIKSRKSMSRFGDGEFAVMAGQDRQKFQRVDKALAERLGQVLESEDEDLLVCIPNIYGDLSMYNEECKYNIRAYLSAKVRREHYELLDMSRTYYDAYVTRPYASYVDNNTDAPKLRFDKLKSIWQDKKLLIIEGEKTRMGVGNDLFHNASDIIRILGPAEHAFDRYEEILAEALKQDKDRLVLIAMGATATVLAYDLAKAGFQALDIGHIDIEYEWMLAGKGKKVPVKSKYNNEVSGGDVVQEIHDPVYQSQIIARIY